MGTHTSTSAKRTALNLRIEHAAKELQLPLLSKEFDKRCEQAAHQGEDPREILADLLESELEARQQRSIHRRLKEAGFPRLKTIDDFDFAKAVNATQLLIHIATAKVIHPRQF